MSQSGHFNNEAFDYYPALNKVREYFEKNDFQPLSLVQAASIAALEPKYFGKFFREKVGIGFKQWTTMVRIRIAAAALQQAHRPIADIAFAIGFQELRTFERAFKKQIGVTPGEFRKAFIPLRRTA